MDKNNAKSASRALDVMAHFAKVRAPARAFDIADALKLPRSSTDQLLKNLLNSGYLTFCPNTKTYFPSARLSAFSEWMTETYPYQAELGGILTDVHEATGHTVTVTMQNDCFMQILDYRGLWNAMPAHVGLRTPMVGSSIGGAVLATKGDTEVRKVVARALRMRVVKGEAIDLAGVSRLLVSYRQWGFAWTRVPLPGAQERGPKGEMFSLAVPLPRRLSRTSMALGLAGPAHRIINREREIVGVMKSSIQRRLPQMAASA